MLNKNDSVLIMIDVQEKLVNMLDTTNKEEAASKSLKIIKAADILNIPFVITEQYPKGLGLTIEEIRTYLGEKYLPFEKTAFSLVKEEEIYNALIKEHKKQAVLFGIESHICVFQTAIELKEKGYEVYVVSDISFSRSDKEKEAALKNLRHFGILTLTLESVLFMWLETSKNPCFKEIQALIK